MIWLKTGRLSQRSAMPLTPNRPLEPVQILFDGWTDWLPYF